jgi:hypothetical protein
MPSPAARRARALYRRDTVEHRLKRFTEPLDSEAVRASREFHLRHWLSLAEEAIQRDHLAAFYRGLQPNVEGAVLDHTGDDFPVELQRSIMADLAFMEGHLQAFRDVMGILQAARNKTSA